MPTPARLAVMALLLALPACAGKSGPEQQFRDRSVLTHEQLNAISYPSAYDAVEALRSNWLRTRGPSSPNDPGEVQVIYNGTRLGGVQALRGISTQEIVFIRFYDAASAAARWGRDFAQGAIHVSTERR